MTKKARIINQLDSLSVSEKEAVIAFFNEHPVYENRVDWNNKTLVYGDFEKIFAMAKTSGKRQKREANVNPEVLFKGYNCRIVKQTKRYFIVMPLDWECAVFLNSYDCGGEGARWCIGQKNNFYYWNRYISGKNFFYFIFFIHKHPEYGKKVILQYSRKNNNIRAWGAQDNEICLKNSEQKSILTPITKDIESLQDNDFPKEVDPDSALNYILRLIGKDGFSCQEVMGVMQAFSGLLGKKYMTYSKIQTENIYNLFKAVYGKFTEKA